MKKQRTQHVKKTSEYDQQEWDLPGTDNRIADL